MKDIFNQKETLIGITISVIFPGYDNVSNQSILVIFDGRPGGCGKCSIIQISVVSI